MSDGYPPVLGGSEVEAQRVAYALRQKGHEVKVLCAGQEPMPVNGLWTDPYGTPVKIIGKGKSGTALHRAFAAGVVADMVRLRHSYDIVYFLMQGLHLAAGLPVARLLGKPILMKISGSGIITNMQQSFFGRLELKWLAQWAARVMILNDGIATEARQAGIAPERLYWMPNPVDTEEFAPVSGDRRALLRQGFHLSDSAPVALFVGRLAPEKELASLIDAFRLVVNQRPEAQLVLVGDGPERAALQKQSSALGLDSHIRFTGRQPMDQVVAWLQIADLFTLVSSLEGFPCSLVEAMSTGLPAVASDIAANRQLIAQGEHGYLAKLRDPSSIAQQILRIFEDPAKARLMGQTGRDVVCDRYSTDHIVRMYEDLFQIAMAQPRV